MCGIAGIFAHGSSAAAAELGELSSMCRRMRSRGPDGGGEWTSEDGRIALGHRRLAILDPTDRALQPMQCEDARRVVTYNGEIYNFRELRRGLESRGARFRTESDTEVLLHLHAERGEAMVDLLRGMFAFALWDARERTLLLARDPYGIKPLYYADTPGTLRFASQVKALLAGGGVDTEHDAAGRVGFYLFGSVPEPHTLYRHIHALPAGCTLQVDARGARQLRRYFSIASVYQVAARATPSPHAAAEAIRDSVRQHLVSDVPVGAFLSAGVDSGAIVGLMAAQGSSGAQTVTVAFDEFEGKAADEGPLAAEVAHRYGVRHAVRRVTREELEADLPAILDAMDQPSIDGMNTWFVSKAMHELGIKVALSGLGGDELLGGYPSFIDLPRWRRTMALPSRVPLLGRGLRRLSAPVIARSSRMSPKLAGIVELGGTWPGAYLLRRGLFMPWELSQVLPLEVVEEGLSRLRPLELIGKELETDPGSDFARVATLESSLYMKNQLLRDTDWSSMAHSLEVRVPLVDRTLLERAAPTLSRTGPAGGKRMLAALPAPPLPPLVVERKKTGFTTPIADWLYHAPSLDRWSQHPVLSRPGTPWARRLAYALDA